MIEFIAMMGKLLWLLIRKGLRNTKLLLTIPPPPPMTRPRPLPRVTAPRPEKTTVEKLTENRIERERLLEELEEMGL